MESSLVYLLYPLDAPSNGGESVQLKPNDVLSLISCEDEWWTATYNGRVVFVPFNYVKRFSIPPGPRYRAVVTVEKSDDTDVLPIAAGDVITRICEHTTGWSMGMRGAKVGLYLDEWVEAIPETAPPAPLLPHSSKADTAFAPPPLPATAPPRPQIKPTSPRVMKRPGHRRMLSDTNASSATAAAKSMVPLLPGRPAAAPPSARVPPPRSSDDGSALHGTVFQSLDAIRALPRRVNQAALQSLPAAGSSDGDCLGRQRSTRQRSHNHSGDISEQDAPAPSTPRRPPLAYSQPCNLPLSTDDDSSRTLWSASTKRSEDGDEDRSAAGKRCKAVSQIGTGRSVSPDVSAASPTARTESQQKLLRLLMAPPHLILCTMCLSADVAGSEAFAKDLVVLFQENKQVLSLLKNVIACEVDRCKNESTLLRLNNLSSHLLTHFARSVGAPYLHHMLSTLVAEVALSKKSLDLRRDASGGLSEGQLNLQSYTARFLDSILKSRDRCPLPLAHLCHTLKSEVMQKFPNSKHSILAGFFFLRFVCPAVISPDGFGLVKVNLSENARRTLVLVSKVLQKMGNGKEFDPQDEGLSFMNTFMKENRDRLNDFLESLSTVPDTLKEPPIPEEIKCSTTTLSAILLYIQSQLMNVQEFIVSHDNTAAQEALVSLMELMSHVYSQLPSPAKADKLNSLPPRAVSPGVGNARSLSSIGSKSAVRHGQVDQPASSPGAPTPEMHVKFSRVRSVFTETLPSTANYEGVLMLQGGSEGKGYKKRFVTLQKKAGEWARVTHSKRKERMDKDAVVLDLEMATLCPRVRDDSASLEFAVVTSQGVYLFQASSVSDYGAWITHFGCLPQHAEKAMLQNEEFTLKEITSNTSIPLVHALFKSHYPSVDITDFSARYQRARKAGVRMFLAYIQLKVKTNTLMDRKKPIGLACFRLVESLSSGHCAYVEDVIVAEEMRRIGIGSYMMMLADFHARSDGCLSTFYRVEGTNESGKAFLSSLRAQSQYLLYSSP